MTRTTLSPSTPQRESSADWPIHGLPEHWMDSLFERMEGFYGAKFANAWAGTNRHAMKRMWAIELATMSRDELAQGVKALRSHEWPPTLPEFLNMCKPPINYDAALYEAAQQMRLRADGRDSWSNPAFYWAAVKVGDFDMINQPHGALIKRFIDALNKVLAQDRIEPVPPRAIALPAPGKSMSGSPVVNTEIAKMRSIQKVKEANTGWAKKILEREKKGEKISIAVVDMAKRALGLQIGSVA